MKAANPDPGMRQRNSRNTNLIRMQLSQARFAKIRLRAAPIPFDRVRRPSLLISLPRPRGAFQGHPPCEE
jgi:hypothetical protein